MVGCILHFILTPVGIQPLLIHIFLPMKVHRPDMVHVYPEVVLWYKIHVISSKEVTNHKLSKFSVAEKVAAASTEAEQTGDASIPPAKSAFRVVHPYTTKRTSLHVE